MFNQENEYIFRQYFKFLRMKNECKLETLAKELNISTSYLSQWENNKRNLNEKIVNEMFSFFKTSGTQVRENFNKNIDILQMCYLDIIYIKELNRFEEFEKTTPNNFIDSMEYPYYLVIKYFYNCGKPDDDLQSSIEKLLPQLTDDFIGIFYLTIGCAYNNIKNYNKSIVYFRKGLKMTNNPYITSMIHFNSGNTYQRCSNSTDAYDEILIAKSQFEECLAINRSIACMNSLGVISLNRFQYDKSIEILKRTKTLGDYLNVNFLSDTVTNNLAWAYLLKGDYSESLVYSEKLFSEYNRTCSSAYFYVFYNLVQLGKLKEAEVYYHNYQSMIETKEIEIDFHNELIGLVKILWFDNKPKSEVNSRIKEIYEIVTKFGSIEMKLLILDLIVKYYEKKRNYKKCNEFLLCKDKLMSISRIIVKN